MTIRRTAHCSAWCRALTVFVSASALIPAQAAVMLVQSQRANSSETQAKPRVVGAAHLSREQAATQRKLDGYLREIAQRYPELTAGNALHSLRAINPSARFQLLTTESIPRVLVDAVADRDTQALQLALARLGFVTT